MALRTRASSEPIKLVKISGDRLELSQKELNSLAEQGYVVASAFPVQTGGVIVMQLSFHGPYEMELTADAPQTTRKKA